MPVQLLPGFDALNDVLANRLSDDETIRVVDEAIQQTLAVHNENTNKMLELFCTSTDEFKIRYRSPFNAYLQPHDLEYARSKPVKGGGYYDVAFPLAGGTIGYGWTRKQRIKSSVLDANNKLEVLIGADKRYLRYNILAALFQASDYVYEDQEHGSLTVKSLANGDSQEYLLSDGAESATTANHFGGQTAAITDAANPFPTIHTKLASRPENGDGGRVIHFVPANLSTSVQNLATFIEAPDPDVRESANTRLLVGTMQSPLPGEVLGKVGKSWIVEWKTLPDNYILSINTAGDRPLAMREEPEAELRGFRAVAERSDHPYTERQYDRIAGFGVMNRLSAHVYQIGSATYAVPTGFDRASVM